jgi:hypothetical protein
VILTLVAEKMGFDPSDTVTLPITRNLDYPSTSPIEFKNGTFMPQRKDVEGDVLFLGDVWRTGGLLRYGAKILRDLGATVSIGVVYLRTDFEQEEKGPDFFGAEASDAVLFDWHTPPQGYGPIIPVRRMQLPSRQSIS